MAGTTQLGKAEAGVENAIVEAARATADVTLVKIFLISLLQQSAQRHVLDDR
jgi:hypothetical protein